MTSMETVKRTEERNEYSGKVQLQVLMLFPRQLLLAAVRGLLEQINLPPDSAQPCLYYVWERDPRRGPCSYSLDCIKKITDPALTAELQAKPNCLYFSPLDFFF